VRAGYDEISGKTVLRINSKELSRLNPKLFNTSGQKVFMINSIDQTEVVFPASISQGMYIAEIGREMENYRIKVLVR
jgi:hypothetical protein